MGEIIQFPGIDERKWRELEEAFRRELLRVGAKPAMIDWVLADMKPRVLSAPVSRKFGPYEALTPGAASAVRQVASDMEEYLHDVATALLGQMLAVELELYNAVHSRQSGEGAS
jgi:hypothetical protein